MMADQTPQVVPEPTPSEMVLPPRRPMTRRRWCLRGVIWGVLAAAFVFLLWHDIDLMCWRYRMIPGDPPGFLRQLIFGFRDFGQFVPIVVGLIIVAIYDRRRWVIIAVALLAQLLAAVGYDSGKFLIARWRPADAIERVAALPPDGDLTMQRTWIARPSERDNKYQSFPSGHSAAAFAFAGVLAWFCKPLRWLLWTLAAGCAVSRYLDAVHWPSDCLAGAIIGYTGAWIALRPYVWGIPFAWLRRRGSGSMPGTEGAAR